MKSIWSDRHRGEGSGGIVAAGMPIPARMFRLALLLATVGCSPAGSAGDGVYHPDARFGAYWNQGKAEITRYALEQARYGEIRHGDAVLIFVTEDFLADRQVKLESSREGKQVVPILKLNLVKKFVTGIYPYSMMTSVFTPVEIASGPATLKVSTSSQEWCGHTYTQLNLRDGRYHVEEHSYFEDEGDREGKIDRTMLEDEVWTRLRLAPESLPTGRVRFIPGTMTARLRHRTLAAEDADASMDSLSPDLERYTIRYRDGGRTLAIDLRRPFPHEIEGWSESYVDGFGPKAKLLTTRALRTNRLMIDYWKKNGLGDTLLRRELGLDFTSP